MLSSAGWTLAESLLKLPMLRQTYKTDARQTSCSAHEGSANNRRQLYMPTLDNHYSRTSRSDGCGDGDKTVLTTELTTDFLSTLAEGLNY